MGIPLSVASRPHDLAAREHLGLQKRLVLDEVVGRRVIGDAHDAQPIVALPRDAGKVPFVHPEPSVRTARGTVRGELAVHEDLEDRTARQPQLERGLAVPVEMSREGDGRVDLVLLSRRPYRLRGVKLNRSNRTGEQNAYVQQNHFQIHMTNIIQNLSDSGQITHQRLGEAQYFLKTVKTAGSAIIESISCTERHSAPDSSTARSSRSRSSGVFPKSGSMPFAHGP